MGRKEKILKYVDVSGTGIEVAPYFNPTLAKRDGYDIRIMDISDTERLRERASVDPHVPNERIEEIEAVDIVADASSIGDAVTDAGLTGKLDYIISSHNFEHLPNPVRFLRGCQDALKPNGVLSMAVPDYRACFDHFRMPTRLSDWISAYHDNRERPTPETVFDAHSLKALYYRSGENFPSCHFRLESPNGFEPGKDLVSEYENYRKTREQGGDYKDVHCSVFFPALFELLISDLRMLRLIDLEIIEITKTYGHEFFVHLRKPSKETRVDEDAFFKTRHRQLTRVSREMGAASYGPAILSEPRFFLTSRLLPVAVKAVRWWRQNRA